MKPLRILTLLLLITSALAQAQLKAQALTASTSSITSASKAVEDPIRIKDVSIDSMGDLKWKTLALANLSGQVEEFKNNKWVKVHPFGWMSIACKSPSPVLVTGEMYMPNFTRVKFHKGVNRYRIRITEPVEIIPEEIQLNSSMANDDHSVWIINQHVILERKAYYEIINNNGLTLLKGEAEEIDVSSLQKGDTYYLYTKKETKKFVR